MRITQGVAFSEFLHQPMHRRPPALGQPTSNFTLYKNPHHSLKKRNFWSVNMDQIQKGGGGGQKKFWQETKNLVPK